MADFFDQIPERPCRQDSVYTSNMMKFNRVNVRFNSSRKPSLSDFNSDGELALDGM
jgi:hypothetical protein